MQRYSKSFFWRVGLTDSATDFRNSFVCVGSRAGINPTPETTHLNPQKIRINVVRDIPQQ
jgi:hypothetical protein